jgi:predicted permease
MALSLILLVGALLFVRTLRNLTTLDAGFREENLLVVNLDLRRAQIPEERRLTLYQEITDKLASIPGVASAAQTFILPVSGSGWNNNILVGGVKQKDFPNFNAVSAGFFHTMGTPILAGRDFSEHDTPSSPPVAIINESFAKKFFAGRNPIGQTFQIETPPGDPRPYYEVVGIVKDTKYTDLREPFGPIGYFPALQRPADEGFQVVMRLTRPPQTVTSVATQSIADVNRTISIQYQTMSTTVEQSLIRERLMATLSGFFGGLAALLAAIGLYGMMAYMVARRRGEIGIRMALGADAREVVSMVMREAAALVSVGVVTGLVLSVLAAQAAATLLFGLEPHDPVTLALAALTLTGVAAAATFVPARRASRLDPTIALKEE